MYLNVDRQRVADQWPPECRLQYWRRGAICLDSCDETLDSANLGLDTETGTRRGAAVLQCCSAGASPVICVCTLNQFIELWPSSITLTEYYSAKREGFNKLCKYSKAEAEQSCINRE